MRRPSQRISHTQTIRARSRREKAQGGNGQRIKQGRNQSIKYTERQRKRKEARERTKNKRRTLSYCVWRSRHESKAQLLRRDRKRRKEKRGSEGARSTKWNQRHKLT